MLNQERLGDSINVPSNLKTACKLYCEEVKWSKGGGGGKATSEVQFAIWTEKITIAKSKKIEMFAMIKTW